MIPTQATAMAFALAGDVPSDAQRVLHVDPDPAPGDRRLLAIVEPQILSPRGFAIAAAALDALRDAFVAAAALPTTTALAQALVAANRAVWDESRPAADGSNGRRVPIGVSAIAIAGRRLTIAQVPPSQVIIIQEGQLYAFPSLASRRPHYVPESDRPDPEPLGCAVDVAPLLYRTTVAAGDLVLLCSSAIAHHLAAEAPEAPGRPDAAVHPLVSGDLEATLARIEQIVVAHDLDTAHAACVELEHVPGRHLRSAGDVLSRLGPARSDRGPSGRAAGGAPLLGRPAGMTRAGRARREGIGDGVGVPLDRDLDDDADWLDEDETPEADVVAPPAPVPHNAAAPAAGAAQPAARADGAQPFAEPAPVSREEVAQHATALLRGGVPAPPGPDPWGVGEAPARTGALDRAQAGFVGAFERVAPRRRPPALPFDEATRREVVPGALSVHVYRDRGGLALPDSWRAALPRGPMVRLPGRLLTAFVVVLLALGVGAFVYNRRESRSAHADAALARADAQLSAAAKTNDPRQADAELTLAQHSLDDAAHSGAARGEVASRQQALNAERDQARGIVRLAKVTRVGGLPAGLAGKSVRLARGGSDVYVVGGGLYQLDASDHRLVQLLASGSQVGQATIGALEDATWDGEHLVATDGAHIYTLAANGRWQPQALGLVDGKTPWQAAACGVFEGNVYFLDPDAGQILKFPADTMNRLPDDWASAGVHSDLATAQDMVVEGKIYVLLADGRVLRLYRGALEAKLQPAVVPAIGHAVALYGGADTNYLYIADAGANGRPARIVRIDRNGTQVAQYTLPTTGPDANPAAAQALSNLRDFVVDETTGTLYFVTGDAIWTASFPPTGTTGQ